MEFREVTFTVRVTQTGLIVEAVGNAPDPALTQPEIYQIVDLLNDGEPVVLDSELTTSSGTHLSVTEAMVAAALRLRAEEELGQ